MRQVPTPSASAWLVDLSELRGPVFCVLRASQEEAREALIAHLLEIGQFDTREEAVEVVADAPTESVGVVW
jgi:hypothetical protein